MRFFRRLLKVTLWLLLLAVIYIGLLESNFLWLTGYMPDREALKNPEVSVASELYTVDSILIGKYYKENRTPVGIEEVSPLLIRALICTEDIRFFEHNGFDLKALFGSMVSAVKGDERGGSTITQQLVKNLFQTRSAENQGLLSRVPGVRTFIYKSKEWVTALKLELFYSKFEILEMYLNTVDFGNNRYGIKVASHKYFNKEPVELNLQESALLVGMLKATTTYNPYRNATEAMQRRNVVLGQLMRYDVISPEVFDSVSKTDMVLYMEDEETDLDNSYIRSYVEKVIRPWCERNGYDLYEDGLRIYTTIDSALQNYAEKAMHDHLARMQKLFHAQWGSMNPWRNEKGKEIPGFLEDNMKRTGYYKSLSEKFKGNTDTINYILNLPKKMTVFTWDGPVDTLMSSMDSLRHYTQVLQGGMMSYDPFSGAIRAYVGGNDFRFFKYDHVTQSKRQPGSTFKTFAYTAAIDKGYAPCDTFIDKPVFIWYNDTELWEPRNTTWTYTFYKKSLRRALGQSVNTVTAQLTEKIGWDAVADYAQRLGIKSTLARVPSICLGSSDVSVYELSNAYGTILADGIYKEPVIISAIADKNGKTLDTFEPEGKRVISSETAWLMRYMLLGCIQEPRGTSQALWSYDLFKQGNQVTGKTGTSSNYSDAWYVGMSKNLITTVWTGTAYRSVHFRNDMGQGSRLALPIFAEYLQMALKSKNSFVETGPFPPPEKKIKRQYICNYPDSAETPSVESDTLLSVH